MSFEFPFTCPQIDEAKDQAKAALGEQIQAIYEKFLPDHVVQLLVDRYGAVWIQQVHDVESDWDYAIDDSFERVRRLNEDMREAAEHQIDGLLDELSLREGDIEQLQAQLRGEA